MRSVGVPGLKAATVAFLAVEHKGKVYATNDDSKEKCNVGELWAEKSGGKAILLMTLLDKGKPGLFEQIAAQIGEPLPPSHRVIGAWQRRLPADNMVAIARVERPKHSTYRCLAEAVGSRNERMLCKLRIRRAC